jgi:hypothetical protein
MSHGTCLIDVLLRSIIDLVIPIYSSSSRLGNISSISILTEILSDVFELFLDIIPVLKYYIIAFDNCTQLFILSSLNIFITFVISSTLNCSIIFILVYL